MPSQVPDPTPPGDESSARDRIRDAAIVEFADTGVDGTSLKRIASRAGVSPALIVHHFGSKDSLREACDAHVAAVIRANKLEQVSQGAGFDPLGALRSVEESRPLLRYLARTLGDGRPQVTKLVDEMIDDAHEYMAEGVRSGMMLPSAYPRERTAILVLWSLGLLSLHEHVGRHLGFDLLSADTAALAPYLLPVTEMLDGGVLAEGMHDRMRSAFDQLRDEEGSS